MVEYVEGDIFEIEADWRVNPVNAMGAAGAGLARAFRNRYPGSYVLYRERCSRHMLLPGQLFFDHEAGVVYFATKGEWKNPSRVEWIEKGLRSLAEVLAEWDEPQNVSLPRVGCGLGGLDWDAQVRPLVEHYLSDIPHNHTPSR